MTTTQLNRKLTNALVLLRVFIGWHFLYEGIVKVYNPDWTSFGYLASAQGPFSSVFGALTGEAILPWVDTMNWLALMFVGITLILGIFEKAGALVGMALLAMYYLAHPSFPWLDQINVEGSYWFVNKNLIELVACWILFLQPTGATFGLTRLLSKTKTAQS
ncbi:DoxX family membrane protein [Robiginitalea sediminis]|uniref:DoxX family membrane protein n=1 Tax=Robiginitalea sediminis TaxID=1982593 RepID=UPI000B4C114F|nr:DoxX family membrane protein [Robiginitalea sediminis]